MPFNPFASAASQMSQSGNYLQGQLSSQNPGNTVSLIQQYMNPYQKSIVQQRMDDMDRQRQMAMSQIGADASAAGAFGGSRHGIVEGMANRDWMDRMNRSANDLMFRGWQEAGQQLNRDRAYGQGLASHVVDLGKNNFTMGQALNNALREQGKTMDQQRQKLLDLGRDQTQGYLGQQASGLEMLSRLIHGSPQEADKQKKKGFGVEDGLKLAAAIFGGFGFSDRRLKTKIQEFAKAIIKGREIAIYTWDWNLLAHKIGAALQPRIGFIAQDMLRVLPEAVSMGDNGYYKIDYSKLHGYI